MIIHKLIIDYLKYRGTNPGFYHLQATDAIAWLRRSGVTLDASTRVLDLGCGYGLFGGELAKMGCQVTMADEVNFLNDEFKALPFRRIDLNADNLDTFGAYDLVVCSNVLEHLAKPERLLAAMHSFLTPTGRFYLSWTNWLSPWGGHEFSPFHYFGAMRGHHWYNKIVRGPRLYTPYVDLFPTYIGGTLRRIRSNPKVQIIRLAPRYYPEFAFLMRLPILREFLAWNCAILLGRTP